MNSARYTRGPWRQDCSMPHVIRDQFGIVGSVTIRQSAVGGPDASYANARLIVAAPELFEEIEREQKHECDMACDPANKRHTKKCIRLSALIAKVKGV